MNMNGDAMNGLNCILLCDNKEKQAFWETHFATEETPQNLVFSSYADEDPEELSLLYHPDIVILDVEKRHSAVAAIVNRYLACSSDVRVIVFSRSLFLYKILVFLCGH